MSGVGKFNGDIEFVNWYVTQVIDSSNALFFWFCLYTEQQISNTFENSVNILKKREKAFTYIDQIIDGTKLTREYYVARLKLNLPKAFNMTFEQLKTVIESGKFTAVSREAVARNMSTLVQRMDKRMTYGSARSYAYNVLYDITPSFEADFVLIINLNNLNTTPFGDNVTNTDTQIKALRDEALSNRDLCLSATSLDDAKKYAALVVSAADKAANMSKLYNTSIGANAAKQAAGYASEVTSYVQQKVTKQKQTMLGAGVGVLALGLFAFGTKKRK